MALVVGLRGASRAAGVKEALAPAHRATTHTLITERGAQRGARRLISHSCTAGAMRAAAGPPGISSDEDPSTHSIHICMLDALHASRRGTSNCKHGRRSPPLPGQQHEPCGRASARAERRGNVCGLSGAHGRPPSEASPLSILARSALCGAGSREETSGGVCRRSRAQRHTHIYAQ